MVVGKHFAFLLIVVSGMGPSMVVGKHFPFLLIVV